MSTVLVLGAGGHLGGEVVRLALAAGHRVAGTWATRTPHAPPGTDLHRLDLRERRAVADLVRRVRPDTVVNAAYRQDEWPVTADGAAHAALAAAAAGARLVHVSSDAVFSGSAPSYPETAHPDPRTPYGAAKAAAETAVAAVHPDAVIARTSLIIGGGASAHERRVHALAAGAPGALFTDDVRCPVHAGDLARALLELAATDRSGVHHLAGPHALSRHELGVLIARRDGLDPGLLPRGRRAESGPPGPLEVRLDCTATRAVLDTELRGARAFLARAPH